MKVFRLILVGGIIILCILLLSSCKGRDSIKGEPSSDSSAPPEDGFVILFCPKWQPQAQFAGVYMALEKGFYAQHGLDVQLQDLMQANEAIDSLSSGSLDIIHLDLLSAIIANREQSKLVNIGQISQRNAMLLVAKKSKGMNSITDFEGKKLGIWRSSSNLITRAFLKEQGISMQFIPIDWSINLFLQGAVDVINAMRYNEYHQILQAGLKKKDLLIIDLHKSGCRIPDEGFYASPQFYSQHPLQCKAFTQATKEGWLYAFDHPDETIDVVINQMQNSKIRANRPHQIWMLDEMKKNVMPSTAEMGILKREDFQSALKLLKQTMDFPKDIAFEEFYPDGAE